MIYLDCNATTLLARSRKVGFVQRMLLVRIACGVFWLCLFESFGANNDVASNSAITNAMIDRSVLLMENSETRVEGFADLLRKGAWDSFISSDDDPTEEARAALHGRAAAALRKCPEIDTVLSTFVGRLDKPDTRLQALSDLIRFAGTQLIRIGSVMMMSGDEQLDELQRKASDAVWRCVDIETVGKALDSGDAILQRWAARGFRKQEEDRPAWSVLLPKLQKLAIGGDEQQREEALEDLRWYPESREFFDERIRVETSAYVLLRLMPKEEYIKRLYVLLRHADESVRHEALGMIGGNSNMAEMYRMNFDAKTLGRVIELAESKSEEERFDAVSALVDMRHTDLDTSRAALLRLAKDKSAKVRWRVAYGLVEQQDRADVRQAIDALIKDESPLVRYMTISAVGREKHLSELKELTRSSDNKIAEWAKEAVKYISEKQAK